MTRRALSACSLALLAVLGLATLAAASPAPADESRLYLPALRAGGTAAPLELRGTIALRPLTPAILAAYQPERYLLVLDVSGSMNTNFAGQGWRNGEVIQCAQGGPSAPPSRNCGAPTYAWHEVSERRIYLAKQAAMQFISGLNMPGNPDYDAALPSDQLTLIWYNEQARADWRFPASWGDPGASDPAALTSALLQAGAVNGDPYLTTGGTNGAGALYRARLALSDAPASVEHGGAAYTYRNEVALFTDGVQNIFLDTTAPTLSGGRSGPDTYPLGSQCRELGEAVGENGACQTNEVGGLYQGRNRPISETVAQAAELKRLATVTVIAFTDFDRFGLDNVASPEAFLAVVAQREDEPGYTVDEAFAQVALRQAGGAGCATIGGGWTSSVPAESVVPDPLSGAAGEVALVREDAIYRAPILRDAATGALSFSFDAVPPGDYRLSASLDYRAASGQVSRYNRLPSADGPARSVWLTVPPGSSALNLGELRLSTGADVCAAP